MKLYNLKWASIHMIYPVGFDQIHVWDDSSAKYTHYKLSPEEHAYLLANHFAPVSVGEYCSYVIGPREHNFEEFLNLPWVKEHLELYYQSKPFHCVAHPERKTDSSTLYIFKKVK